MVTLLHPHGCSLACGERDGTLSLCQIPSRTLLWRRNAHQGIVTVLAWNAAGTLLASGGQDGQIHVWQSSTGKKVGSFPHGRAVQRLSWSPQDQLASVSGSRILLWTLSSSGQESS